jgi:hypothetical protein
MELSSNISPVWEATTLYQYCHSAMCAQPYQYTHCWNNATPASSDYATGWTTCNSISFRTTDFLCKMSRPALMPWQSLIQWVPGALAPAVKWPGLKAEHSPPTNAKMKNEWSYTMSTCLNGVHREIFTFTSQPANITATGMKPCTWHLLQQKARGCEMWNE